MKHYTPVVHQPVFHQCPHNMTCLRFSPLPRLYNLPRLRIHLLHPGNLPWGVNCPAIKFFLRMLRSLRSTDGNGTCHDLIVKIVLLVGFMVVQGLYQTQLQALCESEDDDDGVVEEGKPCGEGGKEAAVRGSGEDMLTEWSID